MIKEYIKRKQDYEKYWSRNIVITDDDIYVSNVLSGDMERLSKFEVWNFQSFDIKERKKGK